MLIKLSLWSGPIVAYFLKGNTFIDPIDGKGYKKLLPYGYGERIRENALAPGSMSLERHRLIWLYIRDKSGLLNLQEEKSFLHIAPEQCFYKRFKKIENLKYITGDLNSPIADYSFDIHSIPFDSNSFDIIFCNHVLEHVDNDIQCMSELYRVLKPGAWAILHTPIDFQRKKTDEDPSVTDPKERERRFGQYDHVRQYGTDFFTRLESVGFEVEIINYPFGYSKDEIIKYAIPQDEVLYIAWKK